MTTTDSGLILPDPRPALDRHLQQLAGFDLSAPPVGAFDEFATLLAQSSGYAYAMVNWFTDEQLFVGLHTPSGTDLPAVGRTMPYSHGFCPEVANRDGLCLTLPDVRASAHFATNPVVNEFNIHSYVGAALIDRRNGQLLGTICHIDPQPRLQETGQESLRRIKHFRDGLMDFVYEHTHPRT